MHSPLWQTAVRFSAVLALVIATASTAQAVNFGGYIPGGSLTLQIYHDGVPITTPAVAGGDVAFTTSGIQFSQGIANVGGNVTFGVFGAPQSPGYIHFQSRQGAFGAANYVLNSNNPSDPDDLFNGLSIDVSNLAVNLLGTTPIAGGVFNPNGLTLTVNGGSLKVTDILELDPPNPMVVDLTGHSGVIAGASNATYIKGTYTIPILADVPISTLYGNIDAVFSGTLTFTPLPEPGTLALAGLGLLAALPLLRRRLNLARS